MNKIILASHGKLAAGMYDAVKLILGEQQDVKIVSAYVDSKSLEETIKEAFPENPNEEVLVVTDVFGGSVNNAFLTKLKDYPKMHLMTGMNLGMLLECFIRRDTEKLEETVQFILKAGMEGCVYCNALMTESTENNFDF